MSFYQEHIVPQLVKLAMRNRELEPYREAPVWYPLHLAADLERRFQFLLSDQGSGSSQTVP